MMRCSCLRAPSLSFPFALPPLPSSSQFACFDLFPRPPGRGMRGLMSICGCGWRSVCLLVIVPVPLSRSSLVRFSRRSAVGLRSGASSGCGCLLRFLRGFVIVSAAVSSRIRYRMR